MDINNIEKDIKILFQKDDNYYRRTDGPWRWDNNSPYSNIVPTQQQEKNIKWVPWGTDNLYPEQLLFYSDNSPILKGILRKESNRVSGTKIVYEKNNEEIDKSHPLYYTSEGVSIYKFVSLLSSDISYLNTFSFTTQYNKGKNKIVGLYHIPAKSVRSGKQLKSTGEIKKYFISPDWMKINQNKLKPNSIKAFNINELGEPSLYFDKNMNQRDYYYSDVVWDSALNYAILDYEISVFHKSNVKNGLVPGLIITFPNETSPTRMAQIKRTFDERLKGSGNAGKAVFLFAPTSDSIPTITTIQPNDLDKQFELLNKTINEKIILATGIPRILSGIETSAGLSNAGNQIKIAEDVWFKNEIKIKQKRIENAINTICDISGYERIKISNPKYDIFSYGVSDAIIQENFTINEIRESLGKEPIEGGDVIKNNNINNE